MRKPINFALFPRNQHGLINLGWDAGQSSNETMSNGQWLDFSIIFKALSYSVVQNIECSFIYFVGHYFFNFLNLNQDTSILWTLTNNLCYLEVYASKYSPEIRSSANQVAN